METKNKRQNERETESKGKMRERQKARKEKTDTQPLLTVADTSVVVGDEVGFHPQLHLVQHPEVRHLVARHVRRQPLQHCHRRRHLG